MQHAKMLQVLIASFVLFSIPMTVAVAQLRTCQAVYDSCLRWCYGNRAGPDRDLCKRNCTAAFEAVEDGGLFHHQDGSRERCSRRLSSIERRLASSVLRSQVLEQLHLSRGMSDNGPHPA